MTYILIFTIATGLTTPITASADTSTTSPCKTAQCIVDQILAKKAARKAHAKTAAQPAPASRPAPETHPSAAPAPRPAPAAAPTAAKSITASCKTAQCIVEEILRKKAARKAHTSPTDRANVRAESAAGTTAFAARERSSLEQAVPTTSTSSSHNRPNRTPRASAEKRPSHISVDALTVSEEDDSDSAAARRSKTEAGISCPNGTCTAATKENDDDTEAASGPTGIQPGTNFGNISDFARVLGEANARMSELKLAPMCQQFASATQVNSWGQAIKKELHKPNMSSLYSGTRDLHRLCPRYDEMSDDERDGFWLILVSGWAQAESSCNPGASLPQQHGSTYGAPNGTAAGILQLHKSNEAKYTPLSNACKDGDSSNPLRSLRCGLGMLNDLAKHDEDIFGDDSHFESLRPNAPPRCSRIYSKALGKKVRVCKKASEAKLIQQSLRRYSFCHDAGMQTANR
jgi:hypothetical protein